MMSATWAFRGATEYLSQGSGWVRVSVFFLWAAQGQLLKVEWRAKAGVSGYTFDFLQA